MVKRSRRLRTIAQLAEQRMQDAAQALAAANRRLERQKLSQRLLSDSRVQHLEHIDLALSGGSSAFHLKVLNQSVQNLERGLSQVAGKISSVEGEREARKAEWQATRARSEAISRVMRRRGEAEAAAARLGTEKSIDDSIAHTYHGKRR